MTTLFYAACWTENDGIYCCGHRHPTVIDAMKCLVPDGRGFIRAFDAGSFRSLNEAEFVDFMVGLEGMPWRQSKTRPRIKILPK